MSVHIIIDGYNLIRQSSQWSMLDLQDMQLGREALLKALADYKRKKAHRITVVFDAAEASSFIRTNERVQGISVKFSRPGESADSVIKRMSSQFGEKALVVSSDRDIVDYASRQGAAVIGSPEFEMRVSLAAYGENGDGDVDDPVQGSPTTKKKGPGRRLPKRQRRNLLKIRKL